MFPQFHEALTLIDQATAPILPALAAWIALSGLDDLAVDAVYWLRRPGVEPPASAAADQASEPRLAIFVPMWHEHRVAEGMLSHNLSAIRYANYEFFVGAYPNDPQTIAAVESLAARSNRIHVCICPHDGPTSKADCLNWVYQHMLLEEERRGVYFDGVVTHDAEDLIHADSMATIAAYLPAWDMVQVPVLPLKTPWWKLTHGVYCDEFAETQTKDLPVRVAMGGFLPGCGVGTGISRRAIEALAVEGANCVFEPASLTEDYDLGIRLRIGGFRQVFVKPVSADPVATREYFPQKWRAAVRQRTRWVTGIALQTWKTRGWPGGAGDWYWLWRDRKGLVGNPLTLVANLLFLASVLNGNLRPGWTMNAASLGLALQLWRGISRIWFTSRYYGWPYASLALVRVFWANGINAWATMSAIRRFAWAEWKHLPLVWLKTEHAYPTRAALMGHKRRLGEILVSAGALTDAQLERALASKPLNVKTGEWLCRSGLITIDELYEALGLQQGVPVARLESHEVDRRVVRGFPREDIRRWKVLPLRVEQGRMLLGGVDIPTDELWARMRQLTRLEVRYCLITPDNFEALAAEML